MDEQKSRGFGSSVGLDGFLSLLAYTNLCVRGSRLYEGFMDKVMPKSGPVDYPTRFAVGLGAGIVMEFGFLAYGINEAVNGKNFYPLIINAAIKTVPRIGESLFGRKER